MPTPNEFSKQPLEELWRVVRYPTRYDPREVAAAAEALCNGYGAPRDLIDAAVAASQRARRAREQSYLVVRNPTKYDPGVVRTAGEKLLGDGLISRNELDAAVATSRRAARAKATEGVPLPSPLRVLQTLVSLMYARIRSRQIWNQSDKLTAKCSRCGFRGASRIFVRNTGITYPGNLFYCHRCNRVFCAPCSRELRDEHQRSFACPGCGIVLSHSPSSEVYERKRQLEAKWDTLRKQEARCEAALRDLRDWWTLWRS